MYGCIDIGGERVVDEYPPGRSVYSFFVSPLPLGRRVAAGPAAARAVHGGEINSERKISRLHIIRCTGPPPPDCRRTTSYIIKPRDNTTVYAR